MVRRLLFGFFLFALALSLMNCASLDYREVRQKYNQAYFSGNLHEADELIKSRFQSGASEDRLLYLMEGGMLAHTSGDYEKSNRLFLAAEKIIDDRRQSISSGIASIVINDASTDFKGETFEQVMVKFYIALNYLMLENYNNARVYFRRVENLQSQMKYSEASYRQNLAARKLHAIIAEQQGDFNVARVQYKNIMNLSPSLKDETLTSYYILAVREKDARDQQTYGGMANRVHSFNKNYEQVPYTNEMGQVAIILQMGKSAVKESRGKIGQSQTFKDLFAGALRAAYNSNPKIAGAGLGFSAVMLAVADAENPIPRYVDRDPGASRPAEIFSQGGTSLGKSIPYTNYSAITVHNFNDQYAQIVRSNVASIAGRVITALASSYALASLAKQALRKKGNKETADIGGALVGMVSGYAIGRVVSSSLEPDLRSWSLIPATIQIQRLFFVPGTYHLEIRSPGGKLLGTRSVEVSKNSLEFINIRSAD